MLNNDSVTTKICTGAAMALEQVRDARHVGMRKHHATGGREPDAVDEARVIQRVREDDVARAPEAW